MRSLLFGVVLLASPLSAQCPDGGAPPCARPAARGERARAIDRNRIAVLPFRVTTADTLLGEGFAELLAPEFTGEGGPRAIDMSTTLNAWRRAGGGLRSPLAQDAATKLARDIGAGLMAQGSIVGFGERLTVSASLFDATSGRLIGQPARAAGPPDSVETLLRQIATSLLSAAGAATRVNEAARLTSSPAALRAYIEGLALWRRGRWDRAEDKFAESFALDSTFASPAYQAYMLTSQTGRGSRWQPRVVAMRARLPLRERTIVEEMIMPGSPNIAERLANKRRVAERLEDAPEAWFLLGDDLYHTGHSVFGPDSSVTLALAAFNRAVALDPVPVFLYHVMESSVLRRDTATARRMLETYERLEGEEGWSRSWVLAAFLNDAGRLARLRQRGPDTSATVVSAISMVTAADSPIPLTLVDEGFRRAESALQGDVRAIARLYEWMILRAHGRPAAAQRALGAVGLDVYRMPFLPWAWATGDAELDAPVLAAHGMAPLADSVSEARRLCARGLAQAARGHPDSVEIGTLRPRISVRCARLLAVWKEFSTASVSDSALRIVDELLDAAAYGTFMGYEHRLAARMHEWRGDLRGALRAIDHYPRDYRGAWLAPTLREEGRLALLAGDTTRALRAYDHYLELRDEAEPSLVPERDSVRAIVSRLRRPR